MSFFVDLLRTQVINTFLPPKIPREREERKTLPTHSSSRVLLKDAKATLMTKLMISAHNDNNRCYRVCFLFGDFDHPLGRERDQHFEPKKKEGGWLPRLR